MTSFEEKVLELLNLSGTIELARQEIGLFIYPMGPSAPKMLDVSQEEEDKIIDEYIKAYCEYLKDDSNALDAAIEFYKKAKEFRGTLIGQKFLNPQRDFLRKLGKITPNALLQKMQEYHLAMEARWEREKLPDEKLN